METTQIELTGMVELSYDENSTEFKESLEAFKETINPMADKEEMLKHVAFYVTRFGTDGIVEGVGYVGYNDRHPDGEPYSGIMVNSGFDEFDFEIV